MLVFVLLIPPFASQPWLRKEWGTRGITGI